MLHICQVEGEATTEGSGGAEATEGRAVLVCEFSIF